MQWPPPYDAMLTSLLACLTAGKLPSWSRLAELPGEQTGQLPATNNDSVLSSHQDRAASTPTNADSVMSSHQVKQLRA